MLILFSTQDPGLLLATEYLYTVVIKYFFHHWHSLMSTIFLINNFKIQCTQYSPNNLQSRNKLGATISRERHNRYTDTDVQKKKSNQNQSASNKSSKPSCCAEESREFCCGRFVAVPPAISLLCVCSLLGNAAQLSTRPELCWAVKGEGGLFVLLSLYFSFLLYFSLPQHPSLLLWQQSVFIEQAGGTAVQSWELEQVLVV